jgi:activator of HSP90 ATPase
MKTKTIKQKVIFKVNSHEVYEALMNSKKHAIFSGGAAQVSRKVGGKFSVFDGYATGKNIELLKDKKIVQTWRASDWDEGHHSTVTFDITPTSYGCLLSFTQLKVPESEYEDIKRGWNDYYWEPMQKMLEKEE